MADLVNLTIDGRTIQAPPGTLVIDAAKHSGIEVPAFCYYEGLTLQAACRMCLVEVEKMPKLMTACTLPVAEGMVVRTETPQVAAARKSMLEFLLANHPLDCPVCDKGGECELQDMTFRYGAGESRFTEMKVHVDEKQWSPVVFFDNPRCILCYRCVRICSEGMGVGALGVINRGVVSEIAPNKGDHLECDECGMCIDIGPPARRQVRRDRIQPHHQRRELLPAEIRAEGAGDGQYRSPPHGRCGYAAGCVERQERQAGHHGGLVREEGGAGDRRRFGAGAAVPVVPDSRQLPASPGAHLEIGRAS